MGGVGIPRTKGKASLFKTKQGKWVDGMCGVRVILYRKFSYLITVSLILVSTVIIYFNF